MQLGINMRWLDKISDHLAQIRRQLLSLIIFVLLNIIFNLSEHVKLTLKLRVLTSNLLKFLPNRVFSNSFEQFERLAVNILVQFWLRGFSWNWMRFLEGLLLRVKVTWLFFTMCMHAWVVYWGFFAFRHPRCLSLDNWSINIYLISTIVSCYLVLLATVLLLLYELNLLLQLLILKDLLLAFLL